MSDSNVLDELLQRNAAQAATYRACPSPMPTLDAVVISCLDARIEPARFFGLDPGEALVIRNTGGRVTRAVEQELGAVLAMASAMTGRPSRPLVVLVHHTNCGAQRYADKAFVGQLSKASNVPVEVLEPLAITNHESSLREDLARIRASQHLPRGLVVVGVRYDEPTGRAQVVFTDDGEA